MRQLLCRAAWRPTKTTRRMFTRSHRRTLIVGFALGAIACDARDRTPAEYDAALAARIESLVDTLIADPDTGRDTVVTEAREIFDRQGVPSVAMVGDAAAYGFVLINMLAQPPDFRRQFFPKVQEAAARGDLPADAVLFASARHRRTELAEQLRQRAPSHLPLRDEILRLVKDDQAARQRDDFDIKKMEAADRRTAVPLQRILDEVGVPTFEMVGIEAATAFIVMIQHQPASFRAATLPNLKANVDAGQADPESYATVYDRTQQDQGRHQLYGQNFVCGPDRTLVPAPLDEPADVNTRRAKMGLMRLELYARLLRANSPDLCKGE